MRRLISIFLLLSAVYADAEVPAAYYKSIDGKKDAELKTATSLVIRNLTQVSSYSNLPQYFRVTDVYPNSNRWWDMYSNIPLYSPSFAGLNREHSFPKSWWGGSTSTSAYVDLNHLYPSEAAANMAKSNYPLGTVDRSSTINFENGVTTVGYPVLGQGGGARFVFEPADEYKGDFARTYFYMVTCYQDLKWAQQYMYMLQQNTYPTLNDWSVNLLLQWSRQDPVSQKEIDRNEAVYKFQNNRNPFIDFPQLAEYIWGRNKGEAFLLANAGIDNQPQGDPELITPVQDMELDLGQVALGSKVTAQMFFHGQYLRDNLSLRIYSGNKDMFSIPTNQIAAYLVNADNGYWLNITYQPTALGKHSTRLLVSDGGMPGSRGIELTGECLPVPELHAPTATAASDITSYSYVANWLPYEGDVVDYYLVTRTIYSNGNATQQQLVAEDNNLLIEDFDNSDSESYYVQSARLGYFSDPSNVVFVDHSGISGIEADHPLTVICADGCVRFGCSSPHTGVCIYDTTGRMVMYLPEIVNNTEITLPQGVYIVTTDQCRQAMRLIVK